MVSMHCPSGGLVHFIAAEVDSSIFFQKSLRMCQMRAIDDLVSSKMSFWSSHESLAVE